MSFLKLKVPPDLTFLFFGAAIWAASNFFPTLDISFPGNHWLTGILAIIGGLIVIGGIMEFRRVKTTVNPINPNLASTIVTSGVYRFTRNPMYFGMFLLLTAFSIKYLNILSPIFLTGYIVYMNRFQIIPEEKALTEKFGDDYLKYKRSVRRWI